MQIVLETNLAGLKPPKRGKVRDIYDLGDTLLIVATDRISAFDVVLPECRPGKGKGPYPDIEVLVHPDAEYRAEPSAFNRCQGVPGICKPHADLLEGRSMLVKKSQPLPVECIVRGYLTGSGLKEYRSTGSVSGIKLPAGLTEASRLPEPIFTPSTKAEMGEHDVNIDFETVVKLVGRDVAEKIRPIRLPFTAGPARSPSQRASLSPTPNSSSAFTITK